MFGGGGWVLFGRSPDTGMEVYNDFNSNLANLFFCVKERTMAFLKELGFLPLNSRDDFIAIRKFLEKGEFNRDYLKEELKLSEHNLSPPEFEEIREILLENAEVTDVKRAAVFFKMIRYSYRSDIVKLGMDKGRVTTQKVDLIEVCDQSPQAVEAYVFFAVKTMGKQTLLSLAAWLINLIDEQHKAEK